jgi:hypothetical protein
MALKPKHWRFPMSIKQPKTKIQKKDDRTKLKSPGMIKQPLHMGELDDDSLAFLGAVQRSDRFTLAGAKAALKTIKSK